MFLFKVTLKLNLEVDLEKINLILIWNEWNVHNTKTEFTTSARDFNINKNKFNSSLIIF
jgi:hypothetical protein